MNRRSRTRLFSSAPVGAPVNLGISAKLSCPTIKGACRCKVDGAFLHTVGCHSHDDKTPGRSTWFLVGWILLFSRFGRQCLFRFSYDNNCRAGPSIPESDAHNLQHSKCDRHCHRTKPCTFSSLYTKSPEAPSVFVRNADCGSHDVKSKRRIRSK